MTLSFQSLGLSDARVEQLEKLGFQTPTEIQTQAIPKILQGIDVVGLSQTGTGKTAAYSLPIIECVDLKNQAVQALILTPTRELAQQVADAVKDLAGNRRLWVLTVYGGQSIERQIRSLERGVHIVVGTPGRVIDLLNRNKLDFSQLRYAVLDEADEMLSMGFIDDVKKILKRTPSHRQTACFSATMPREVRELIETFLNKPETIKVSQPKAAPAKIDQQVYKIHRSLSKIQALQPILELEEPEAALIFVRTKRSASEITTQLQAVGHSVDEYHGDLSQGQRERLVQRFHKGQIRLVVATDIAARGLDVGHLSHVINFDLPDNPETYIHRIGRTGRAGRTGTAITVIRATDRPLLRRIERKLNQNMEIRNLPDRAQIEARRLAKLQDKVKETLTGERMASFLPLVHELSGEYDPHTIAAAALQMLYDQNCPKWMKEDWDAPKPTKSLKRRFHSKPKKSKSLISNSPRRVDKVGSEG